MTHRAKRSRPRTIRTAQKCPFRVKEKINIVLDPVDPSFKRQQNTVYKTGRGSIYPSPNECIKPQEFMSWRLKRNRKRLSRFQKAARTIQRVLRVYMAKTMIT